MKLVTLGAAAALQIFIFSPQATCQDKAQPERLHLTISVPPQHFYMSASSIERDLSTPATASILELKGNVEIRVVTCVSADQGNTHTCQSALVLNADEAEYHEKTGEIVPRGNVHVSPAAP